MRKLSLIYLVLSLRWLVSIVAESNNIEVINQDDFNCAKRYPSFVSIENHKTFKHVCGGTLLTSKWVLSAAHCFYANYRPINYVVHAGLASNKGQHAAVQKIILHPEFIPNMNINDIALLRLQHPIFQTDIVKFVIFANEFIKSSLCKQGVVIGFSAFHKKSKRRMPEVSVHNSDLKCGSLDVTEHLDDCPQPGLKNFKKFCARKSEIETMKACQGDSGGPFMCGNIQFGIVSTGIGCTRKGQPGSYTNIRNYTSFISYTIKSGGSQRFFLHSSLLLLVIINICNMQ